jgi:hypothetical protein
METEATTKMAMETTMDRMVMESLKETKMVTTATMVATRMKIKEILMGVTIHPSRLQTGKVIMMAVDKTADPTAITIKLAVAKMMTIRMVVTLRTAKAKTMETATTLMGMEKMDKAMIMIRKQALLIMESTLESQLRSRG